MKKKPRRRRIDVDVEELDRIIDGAKSAPLTESDSQKLKTALHALAERLLPRTKTEKTSQYSAKKKAWHQKTSASQKIHRPGTVATELMRIAAPRRWSRACETGARRPLSGLCQGERLHAEGAESAGADYRTGSASRHGV